MIEELTGLVGVILGIDTISPTDRLVEDLDAESMDLVTVLAAVEERFAVEIDDAAASMITTVADLAEAVRSARDGSTG